MFPSKLKDHKIRFCEVFSPYLKRSLPEVPRSASGSVQSIGPPGLSAHDPAVGSWCQCRQACF